MKEKYKYMLLRKLYRELGLSEIEKELNNAGIRYSSLIDNNINKSYFNIMNNVDEDNLSDDMKYKYIEFFSKSVEQLCSNEVEPLIDKFIDNTYKQLLFKNNNQNGMYYGPINDNYWAPSDAIVLGLFYAEFDIEEGNFDYLYDKQEEIICNIINRIQYQNAQNANLKVAVIKYNEFTEKYVKPKM